MRLTVAAVVLITFAAGLALAVTENTPSYAADIEPIFLAACGDCHGADKPKKGLDLSRGKGHAALVDRPSQEVDLTLVKAGDPAGSYLWHKLTHTQTEGKGMPRGIFSSSKLPQEQLDLIERWIVAGAQP
jgi:mono/diheme cytochrome c family protein